MTLLHFCTESNHLPEYFPSLLVYQWSKCTLFPPPTQKKKRYSRRHLLSHKLDIFFLIIFNQVIIGGFDREYTFLLKFPEWLIPLFSFKFAVTSDLSNVSYSSISQSLRFLITQMVHSLLPSPPYSTVIFFDCAIAQILEN